MGCHSSKKGQCHIQKGKKYQGKVMENGKYAQWKCCDLCKNYNKNGKSCKYWNYFGDTGVCYLLEDTTEPSTTNTQFGFAGKVKDHVAPPPASLECE